MRRRDDKSEFWSVEAYVVAWPRVIVCDLGFWYRSRGSTCKLGRKKGPVVSKFGQSLADGLDARMSQQQINTRYRRIRVLKRAGKYRDFWPLALSQAKRLGT